MENALVAPESDTIDAALANVVVNELVVVMAPALETCGQFVADVAGAVPAPPPYTIQFAPSAPEDEITVVLEKYGIPPLLALVG